MKSLQMRLGVLCTLAAVSFAPMCQADTRDKKTTISITDPIEVPGKVLVPGTYVFKLLDSSSNRHIVQILNENESQTYALTFTAAAHRVFPTDKTVLTFYEGKGDSPRALRTWFYPGEYDGQEFIYGKDQAHLIAVSNTTPVEQLASSTRQETTTTEIPAAPAPEETVIPASQVPPPIAETQQTQTQAAAEEPVLLAQAQPPAPINDQPTTTEPAQAPAPSDQLPKTASDLPLIALGGLSALALALGLRRLDRAVNH
jgi:hypothetical protein